MSDRRNEFAWLLAVLVVFLVIPLMMLRPWDGYMHEMMGMMGYGWGYVSVIPIVFLLLIVLGVYYLITESAETTRSRTSGVERAREKLKERYAQGEITREEYLKMKQELE